MSTTFSTEVVSETSIESVRRKIRDIPEVASGWEVFDREVRHWQSRRSEILEQWREVDLRARQHGGNKVYTRGNFLRAATNRAAGLAFHHALSGSGESLELAAEITGFVCAEETWAAQAGRNRWRSDLWTADYSASVSLILNLTGEGAGDAVKLGWRNALLEKGVRPLLADWIDHETRIHTLDTMGHNWWSVCVGGAALGLFEVREDWAEADDWLERIAEGFAEFFNFPGNTLQNKRRTFGADGDYVEPVGYLDYTLHHLLPVLDLYRTVLGRDLAAELPVLEKIPDYYLATVQPLENRFQRLNFGNTSSSLEGGSHNPIATWLWLAGRYRRGDLMHLIRKMRCLPGTPLEFLFWPEGVKEGSLAGLRKTRIFPNNGTAILRNGYEPHATVFAIKTGETWNHNHSDAGSFILSSAGREFIVDPGTTEYTNPLNRSYFWNSEGHNVVLHDGRGQREELHDLGTKYPGRIAGHLTSPGYRYLLADATGPWEGIYQRFYRHVLWIDQYIVLIDDVMASYPAPWTQLLHYRGQAERKGARTVIRNEGESLVVHHVHPVPSAWESREGYVSKPVPNPWKQECRIENEAYLALHYPASDRREKFIQVFELPGGENSQIERIEGENISGVRIANSRKTWEVRCNHLADGRVMHQNAWVDHGRWTTDAFLLVAEWAGDNTLLSLGLHNGSCAKLDAGLLYGALLKGDIRVRYGPGEAKIHSSMAGSASAEVALSPKRPGLRKSVRFSSGHREIRVTA